MSIHTNATPKNSEIRVENEPRTVVPVPKANTQDAVEIELNVPVVALFLILLGIVVYGGYMFFKNGSAADPHANPPATLAAGMIDVTVPLKDIVMKGDVKAPYVFIEFSDFECPYCKEFATGVNNAGVQSTSAYQQIMASYIDTKKMQFGYSPYILATQHNPAATNEAVAFYCANDLGKGYEYQEILFRNTHANGLGLDNQGSSKESLVSVAQGLGLDSQKFSSCYDKRDVTKIDELKARIDLAVRKPWSAGYGDQWFGTPAFAICKIDAGNPSECQGKAFVGAWPFADMKGVIDSYLGQVPTATATVTPTVTKKK